MKGLPIPQKSVCEVAAVKKFYVHEIATVDLSKISFLENAKKTSNPNNRDLNCDWNIQILLSAAPIIQTWLYLLSYSFLKIASSNAALSPTVTHM